MTHGRLTIRSMSPACGGIVEGVDLSHELSSRQFDQIHDALLDRTVLVFRDQISQRINKWLFPAGLAIPSPRTFPALKKTMRIPKLIFWSMTLTIRHTRLWTFGTRISLVVKNRPWAQPCMPKTSRRRGDTIWVNSAAAYEGLSSRMKAHLDGLHAYHDNYQPYDAHVRPDLWDKEYFDDSRRIRAEYSPALHPVVRTHPITGTKGLFVNESMTTFIKELPRRESNYLLQYLFDHLRTPEFQYRHRWRANDLAVWDNRLSLHYALFDYTEHRLMHRIVIKGDKPV